jgi:ABC-type uncharacterized transport system ATPase subunit
VTASWFGRRRGDTAAATEEVLVVPRLGSLSGLLIHARGLVKRFGDFTAVDGIDVDVRRGEAFGFLGPNGAGKSSTMRMIGCVSPPTGGVLRILGLDPRADGPRIRAGSACAPSWTTSTSS